jgi:surfactin synthase thioesterase subunit
VAGESVYAFASIQASLSGHARLFAVDLPGFGIRLGRPRPGHWQLAMAQPKPVPLSAGFEPAARPELS